MKQDRIIVVSAHAMDFLWRCSGAMAQYARQGAPVKVVCLSYGERGESNPVWKENPGITEQEVKQIKKVEAEKAAAILGVEIEFMDFGDHPMESTRERIVALAEIIIDFKPTILLTHMLTDVLNPDHATASNIALSAIRCAHGYGVFPGKTPCKQIKVFMFEPAQPDIQGFRPDTYIDITEVMELKEKAMACVGSQSYLPAFYIERASYRGGLARRHAEIGEIQHTEAYIRLNPYIGRDFV